MIQEPPAAPSVAPDRAPPTIRAPNCMGTFRLGVDGSWSVTNSTIASREKTPGVQEYPLNANQDPPRLSPPNLAAQLTAATAVKTREPATMPAKSASA